MTSSEAGQKNQRGETGWHEAAHNYVTYADLLKLAKGNRCAGIHVELRLPFSAFVGRPDPKNLIRIQICEVCCK
jgi:hypothetical protein